MTIRSEGPFLDWLRQRPSGALSLQEVAHFIRQAADTLQYAHNYQIIYQRVAPFNFLICSNGEHPNLPDLQLVDVRRAASPDGLPNVSDSMAPEQWRGAPVPATDQYALAIMAYQLLTWQSPFQGNQEQMMYQHLNILPQPPSRINPRIPPAVDAVILRALAKKPEDRFPSISAFADAFQQATQAPQLPYVSDPGKVLSTNHAVSTSQSLEQIPPTFNPDIPGISRMSRFSQIRELLLLGLVFIIVVSSIGFGFYSIVKSNQAAMTNSNVTVQATAFPTASAATALARTITSGTPLLADKLSSNTAGRWDTDPTCVFKDGTYHVLVPTADTLNGCGSHKFIFDNVAIQVNVSLLSGNNAGLYFRYNSRSGQSYLFDITRQREFFFGILNGTNLYYLTQPTKTNAVAPGNSKNTLLVLTKDSDFKFYINGVFVGEAQDSTFLTGQIGFVVQTDMAETSGEASFSNLKVFSVGTNSSTIRKAPISTAVIRLYPTSVLHL